MLLGALAWVLASSPAPGQPSLDVRWDGPAACVDEARFSALVVELSRAPADPITLASERIAGDQWRVLVGFEGDTRTIVGADCSILTEAAALIVAVRVDPVQTVSTVRLEPDAEVVPEPEPEPEAEAVLEPEAVPEAEAVLEPEAVPEPAVPRVPWRPTAVAGVAGSLGTLPRGGASFRADVGARRGGLELGAGAIATVGPRSTDASSTSFRMFSGLAQACGVLDAGPVEVPLCGRFEVGVLQGRPQGLTQPNDRNALWVAPGVRAALARRTGRLAPEGFLELSSPLLRHRFEATGVGGVHRLPPAVVRLGFALRWRGAS